MGLCCNLENRISYSLLSVFLRDFHRSTWATVVCTIIGDGKTFCKSTLFNYYNCSCSHQQFYKNNFNINITNMAYEMKRHISPSHVYTLIKKVITSEMLAMGKMRQNAAANIRLYIGSTLCTLYMHVERGACGYNDYKGIIYEIIYVPAHA